MTSAFTTVRRRVRHATQGRPASFAALVVAIIVIFVAAPQGQQAPAFVANAAGGAAPALAAPTEIDLLVGRSTVLNVGSPIARVSLTVPDVADALVTAPGQILIHGKQPGTISLFVWDRGGAITTYEVKVRRDLTALVGHLKQLFPGEPIEVRGSGKDVVVSGTVSSKYVIEKAADVAAGYVEKKENVVNLLKQQEGVASNQVMLRVRFAEVSRSAVTELGASFFTGPGGFHDYVARTTTQQFSAPNFEEMARDSIQAPPDRWGGGRDTVSATGGRQTFGDFLNLFLFNNKYNVGTVIKALSEKGLFQSLAEPNLIATNGKEASFLAGGEYPYPVVQGSAAGQAVTIMFKEFGVRLNFTPTVLGGDLINLKVRPEVSSLDFGNAVTVEGFRVPALSTRRTETEVELRDGQTFAIAGLMSNAVQDSMRKIPGIGDVPILGWLFKSKAMQKQQTELVVMITPHIVRRGQTGVSEGLPALVEPYLGAPARTLPNPDPYVGSPRYPANQQAPADAPAPAPQPGPAPQSALPQGARPLATAAAVPAAIPAAVTPEPAEPSVREQVQQVAARSQAAQAPAPQPAASRVQIAAEPQPAPIASTPIQAAAPIAANPELRIEPAPPTKTELKERDRAREAERKAAERAAAEDAKAVEQQRKAEKRRLEQEKREAVARAAQARVDEKRRAEQAKKDEAQRKQAEKLEEDRRKREAEVAKKNEELARKRQEDAEQRHRQALSEAELRLKQAQEAYQQELAKSAGRGGGS